ncbi:UDP-2,4-diacetamido-2,4,6-trideoxy-beta-L-altropyranose hydrolase [bacterium K02(2017)]|nr:UDP-2,4-diacetamido-2,4,6-trideoxy-beta-L-altropyranose hydrolase [bacterium K02(2017)]
MNIVFRTDASHHIGSGHVYRCLTLALALKKNGHQVLFVCRQHQGHLIELIKDCYKITVRVLQIDTDWIPKKLIPKHIKWLGADQCKDAQETINAIKDVGVVDILVVDHYAIDQDWEAELKKHIRFLVVIDELADRKHCCDVLIDQTVWGHPHQVYKKLLPSHCLSLIGPKYAMLRSMFYEIRNNFVQSSVKNKKLKMLIFLGAADLSDVPLKLMTVCKILASEPIEIHFILNEKSKHYEQVKKLSQLQNNLIHYSYVDDMAKLMSQMDVYCGSGGTITWERCCMGLSGVVFSIAENQYGFSKTMGDKGYHFFLGRESELEAQEIVDALKNYWTNLDIKLEMETNSFGLVDGLGASRIQEHLERLL